MPDSRTVTKAVIPAAGFGTRFLPATKAVPKEMLPVVDKPAIQYVIEEAVAAGLHDVLLVTTRNKAAIEDHFDRVGDLEEVLAAKGDATRLAMVQRASELATVHSVRQGAAKGLGDAVLMAAEHVGVEPFAVLLPDGIIDQGDLLLSRMIEVRRQYGGTVVALMEIDPDEVSRYGSVAMMPTRENGVVTVTDLIEKPEVGNALGNWIVIGRYICDASVFDVLRNTPPGKDGEIQLTDALGVLARREQPDNPGNGVHGVMFHGIRHDAGSQLGYLRTVVHFACQHPELADEFVPWLRKHLDGLG